MQKRGRSNNKHRQDNKGNDKKDIHSGFEHLDDTSRDAWNKIKITRQEMSLVFQIGWGVVFGYLMLFLILAFLSIIGFALFGKSVQDKAFR